MFVPGPIPLPKATLGIGLLVAILGGWPDALRAQHPPVIEGRVLDVVSGAPVVGARVRVDADGLETHTDASGGFVLRGIRPGEARIRVVALGYRAATTGLDARNGFVSRVRIELDPEPVRVAGLDVGAGPASHPDAIVLDREALDAMAGAVDLAAVLQDVPGVVVTRSGGPGAPATVSIRGGSSDQVLVLLDGIPVHAPLTGAVDVSTIPVDGVQRITILPGARSARYGPRALSGVILVEGRTPATGEARARASAGSFGSAGLTGGVGGVTALDSRILVDGRLGGEWRKSDGTFTYPVPDVRGGGTATRLNADTRMLNLNASGGLRGGRTSARGLVDAVDLQRGMPGPVVAPSPTARQDEQRLILGATATLDGPITWDVGLDGQGQSVEFSDPTPPASSALDEFTRARSLGGRVAAGGSKGPLDLEAGVEARILRVTSSSLDTGAPVYQRSGGVWGVATGRVALSRRWTGSATASLRGDRHTFVTGTEWSPRLGVALTGAAWTVKASAGGGFSPPSLADQFFQEGVLVRPNPDLGPERVRREVEVGVDVRLMNTRTASMRVAVDAYRADVDGMILWFPDHRFVWSPGNFDVRRTGIDASVDVGLHPASTRIHASVSRSSVTYGGSVLGGQVAYRPEWTGHVSANATWSVLNAELTGRYVGTRRTVPGTAVNSLDPYRIVDVQVGARWTFGGWRFEPRISIHNAFDASAAMVPDYPLPGRAWGLEFALMPKP